MRYLYSALELEGEQRLATKPNWSLKVFNISKFISKKGEPVLYWPAASSRVVSGSKFSWCRINSPLIPSRTSSSREGLNSTSLLERSEGELEREDMLLLLRISFAISLVVS